MYIFPFLTSINVFSDNASLKDWYPWPDVIISPSFTYSILFATDYTLSSNVVSITVVFLYILPSA